MRTSRTTGPVVLAVAIGAGVGLASVTFVAGVEVVWWATHILLAGPLASMLGALWVVPVLALGGLIVGFLGKFYASEVKGHGVPDVMLAVAHQGGRIHPRAMLLKAVAAAVCIGSGGSAGTVGPLVRIGSALGSAVGQVFRLPDRRVTLSVACGAAGGIAAAFNAPIAGVMFALEVILGRFSSVSFGMVVISSVSATIVSRHILADQPLLALPVEYTTGPIELPFYVVLGILCAFAAIVFTRTLYWVEAAATRVKIPGMLKPAIGGAVVGLVGVWAPKIFGTGLAVIEEALTNNLPIGMLLALCVLKLVCTSITLGSGGSGGIFAPSLFIGAMLGGAFGFFAQRFFPAATADAGAYALVGMAAVFAAAAHAPITAILMIFEMTDNYHVIVPLMTATVIGTVVAQRLSPESIYTLKFRRRGISLGVVQDVNPMEAITVEEAMREEFDFVAPEMPLSTLMAKLATGHETGYPVVDHDGLLVGMITMQDVELALIDKDPQALTVGDVCTKNVVVCRPDQTLSTALAQFGASSFAILPVVDPHEPNRIIGEMRRADIIEAYTQAHMRRAEMLRKADQLGELTARTRTVLCETTLSTGSLLAGRRVREAGFPKHCVLTTIQRGNKTIVPTGDTRLEPGDALMALSTEEHAKTVRQWLKQSS